MKEDIFNDKCFSTRLQEKNCICSEIMYSSDVGILIFKNNKKEPIFWNQSAIKILSKNNNFDNYNDLWNFLEHKKTKDNSPLNINDRLIEFNLYKTDNYKWVLLKDITDEKRLEHIVTEMNLMENLSNIFSSIRHEITNPLITAKITLAVLKKKIKDSPEKAQIKYIERMEDSINRIEKIIASLKSFSLYNTPEFEDIELNEFIKKEIDLLSPYLSENNVDVKLNLFKQPLHINGMPNALKQIFLNIISNGIEAMEKTEQPQISITTTREKNHILLKISNNGEIIPEENLSRIFDPFFTTKPKGTGLGMSIVKKFILKMGGNIEVTSSEEETTLTITFPTKNKTNNSGGTNETQHTHS